MPCGQVTIGASATKLQSSSQRVMQLVIQNNSAHAIRVGDSPLVSTTTPASANGGTAGFGILVGVGSNWNSGTFTSGAQQLTQWYVAGTNTDVIDYQYTPED